MNDINTDFKFDPVAAFDKKDELIANLRAALAHEADVAESYKEQYEDEVRKNFFLQKELNARGEVK
jgi:hypothetical protein